MNVAPINVNTKQNLGRGARTKSLNPQSVSSQSMTSFSKSNVSFNGKGKLLKKILAELVGLKEENTKIKGQLDDLLGTSKKTVTTVEESIPEKPVEKVEKAVEEESSSSSSISEGQKKLDDWYEFQKQYGSFY